jgi:hypothetical protein
MLVIIIIIIIIIMMNKKPTSCLQQINGEISIKTGRNTKSNLGREQ